MKALIVAPNISKRMGGEAVLPFHYIRELRELGVDVHALTHARVREELEASEIWDASRMHFIEDAFAEKAIHRAGKFVPGPIRDSAFNSSIGAVSMARLASRAREIAGDINADIVHQPTPVSPRFPSFLTNMPAPVIIGPMNGGMDFPPAFAAEYSRGSGAVVAAARMSSAAFNNAFTGKRDAAKILVANERTRHALPSSTPLERTEILVENGVDISLWDVGARSAPAKPHFVFVGRLTWWKAVDLLIDAFARLEIDAQLTIIGDGEDRSKLELQASQSKASDKISFTGFLPQKDIARTLTDATALVLPSLRECGGAVVLEAFACRRPAIATDWGGPQDYITPDTGILVPPTSKEAFVSGLSAAMTQLAKDPHRAEEMGAVARRRVEALYTWKAKASQMLEIYRDTAKQAA